ncbi:MAG: hypothetical protein ACR2P2_02290 [Nakamurella sp.]
MRNQLGRQLARPARQSANGCRDDSLASIRISGRSGLDRAKSAAQEQNFNDSGPNVSPAPGLECRHQLVEFASVDLDHQLDGRECNIQMQRSTAHPDAVVGLPPEDWGRPQDSVRRALVGSKPAPVPISRYPRTDDHTLEFRSIVVARQWFWPTGSPRSHFRRRVTSTRRRREEKFGETLARLLLSAVKIAYVIPQGRAGRTGIGVLSSGAICWVR